LADDRKGSEDKKARLDRELIELLNELRIALPGVQVLFAFLLTIPFSQRFGELSSRDRYVYFAGFLFATLATATMIAPTAYHRLRWRARDKERLLEISNQLAIVGLGLLAAAMTCVLYVVTDLIFGTIQGVVAAIVGGLTFAALWYALPLSRKVDD
jgi:predicted membrane channel-forming protein YqfA (hemolysin III family)